MPLVLRETFRPLSQNQPGLLPALLERLRMTGIKSLSPTEEHLNKAPITALVSKVPSTALRGRGPGQVAADTGRTLPAGWVCI